MNCPLCGGESRVVDTRVEQGIVKRRRICSWCEKRFSTVEIEKAKYEGMLATDIHEISRKTTDYIDSVMRTLKRFKKDMEKAAKNDE